MGPRFILQQIDPMTILFKDINTFDNMCMFLCIVIIKVSNK